MKCAKYQVISRVWNHDLKPISLECAAFRIAKFMGTTWGPPGSCQPQMSLMLAPWTLLSGIWWYCRFQRQKLKVREAERNFGPRGLQSYKVSDSHFSANGSNSIICVTNREWQNAKLIALRKCTSTVLFYRGQVINRKAFNMRTPDNRFNKWHIV